MNRYICIHGHFYQPPRENPWLEDVELQDSAYPYHDWNERITAECYAPNGASRILDGFGNIIRIPNNYAKISFNFGPTLLAWLEQKAPEVYATILLADRLSQRRFSGHGSALAQCYNHIIMPLANRRDKETQIIWGIQDFVHRFQRQPEGMWLPETAVDLETLDLMAQHGIKFTILAPRQARRIRPVGRGPWQEVSGEHIDPTRAYLVRLPSGRSLSLFFYDGPISRAVAFEGLLTSGELLAHRLLGAFNDQRPWAQLVHIATDGETYGHHHPHGDMALAYALAYLEKKAGIQLTNYGEYLAKHPPEMEVEIYENSSWSCIHGIGRWQEDCGCHSGGHPGWRQAWRRPLREALDWLRDQLAELCEKRAAGWCRDFWAGRNAYIKVILNRSPETLRSFLLEHTQIVPSGSDLTVLLQLLEIQRQTLLMYTSCGWFFDELSGLETIQILRYAGCALHLAQELFPEADLEEGFLQRLEAAKSNLPEHRDGRRIYEKFVLSARVDLLAVGAHYAVSSIFEDYGHLTQIYCYEVECQDLRRTEAGKAVLVIGRAKITSKIFYNFQEISFAVLHFGDHNIWGGVQPYQGQEAYDRMAWEVTEAFASADFPETIRRIDRHFGSSTYSLRSLFRDEQRQVIQRIMQATFQEVGSVYQQMYKYHVPLMRFLTELGVPLPKVYLATAAFVINLNLSQALIADPPDLEMIRGLLHDARLFQVELDTASLEFILRQALQRLAADFRQEPSDLKRLSRLEALVTLANSMPFAVNLWTVQNIAYELMHTVYHNKRWLAGSGDQSGQDWVHLFLSLLEKLKISIDNL